MDYLNRITHCTFTCRNYEETSRFYGEILGLEKEFTLDFNQQLLDGYTRFGFETEGMKAGDEWITYYRITPYEYIELFNLPYRGDNDIRNEGFMHVTLRVSDAYEAAKELAAKGLVIYSGHTWDKKTKSYGPCELADALAENSALLKDSGGIARFFIKDPEGNELEIAEV